MGTRSITHIYEMDSLQNDDKSKVVCSFYRSYDGHPSGHGQQLADWLKGKNLVNGVGASFRKGIDHNRAGQMAIDLMSFLKAETSIETIPTNPSDGEEYTYRVRFIDNCFLIECEGYGSKVEFTADKFDGERIEKLWDEGEE